MYLTYAFSHVLAVNLAKYCDVKASSARRHILKLLRRRESCQSRRRNLMLAVELARDDALRLRILNPGEKADLKRMFMYVLKRLASTSSRTRKNFLGVL